MTDFLSSFTRMVTFDFLIGFRNTNPFWKEVYPIPKRRKFFAVWVDAFAEARQTVLMTEPVQDKTYN